MRFLALALLLPLQSPAAHPGGAWISHDLMVATQKGGAPLFLRASDTGGAALDPLRCRKLIEKQLCLIEAQKKRWEESACVPGAEVYAPQIERAFDLLPGSLQEAFCHIGKIYVHKELHSTAYAHVVRNEQGVPVAGALGIRKSYLDTAPSFGEFAAWKEQLNFGAPPQEIRLVPGLPVVRSSLGQSFEEGLAFLLAHEIMHIIDLTSGTNELICADKSTGCDKPEHFSLKTGAWPELSWNTKVWNEPLSHLDFPLRKELCFYRCLQDGKAFSASMQDELFRQLGASGFLSVYATLSALEDFAETGAYLLMSKRKGEEYKVITASGLVYDPLERLRSDPLMRAKREYMERLFREPIRYPGL